MDIHVPVTATRDAALNLLLNACAAAPHASTITFRAQVRNAAVEIHIEDSGPGMPDRVRHYLNSPDAHGGPMVEYGGLGLWMVKRLVRETGGTIGAEHRAAGGSIVHLTIPEFQPAELQHVA